MSAPRSNPHSALGSAGQELADNLRAAVCAEDYQEIPGLLARYGEQIQNRLHEVSPNPMESERLLNEAAELLRWAKSAVAANRAHAAAKLSQIGRAEQYRPHTSWNPRTWAVEA